MRLHKYLDVITYDDEADSPDQSVLTWGADDELIVAVDISPIIFNASLQAWYILNISSLLRASSALSSIIPCCKYDIIIWMLK